MGSPSLPLVLVRQILHQPLENVAVLHRQPDWRPAVEREERRQRRVAPVQLGLDSLVGVAVQPATVLGAPQVRLVVLADTHPLTVP